MFQGHLLKLKQFCSVNFLGPLTKRMFRETNLGIFRFHLYSKIRFDIQLFLSMINKIWLWKEANIVNVWHFSSSTVDIVNSEIKWEQSVGTKRWCLPMGKQFWCKHTAHVFMLMNFYHLIYWITCQKRSWWGWIQVPTCLCLLKLNYNEKKNTQSHLNKAHSTSNE